MNKEVKEILEALKPHNDIVKEYPLTLSIEEQKILLNYITNLEKERAIYKARCEYLQRSCERKEEQMLDYRMEYMEQEDYKSRNEKAIEDINKLISGCYVEEKGDMVESYSKRSCCDMRLEIIKKDLLGEDKK